MESDTAERVDIRGRTDGLAADLLGGDVVERSDQVTGLCLIRVGLELLGQAEIREIDVIGWRQQDIRRLDITVYEPFRVSGVESGCSLGDDPRDPVRRKAPRGT